MTIDKMLENRMSVYLEWVVPWPACGADGNNLDACVIHRATVNDCINMARRAARETGHSIDIIDREFLLDFIAVHWAEAK